MESEWRMENEPFLFLYSESFQSFSGSRMRRDKDRNVVFCVKCFQRVHCHLQPLWIVHVFFPMEADQEVFLRCQALFLDGVTCIDLCSVFLKDFTHWRTSEKNT